MKRRRGYALGIVLLVSLLLSAMLTTMFMRLSAASKSSGRHLGLRRSYYLCDGVVNIASEMLKKAAPRTSTLEQLDAELEPLRQGVRADDVIIDELRAEPTADSKLMTVPSGPFAGLGVTVIDLELRIALRANGVPPCRVSETQPLAALSFLQLPAFSALRVDVTASDAFVVEPEDEGIAWGHFAASVDMPDPPDPPPPAKKPDPKPKLQPRVGQNGAPLSLPQPVAPDDARPGLRFLIERPEPLERPSPSRLAHAAGVRIIDGEWYVRGQAWPGRRIWSDHPCADGQAIEECNLVADRSIARLWLSDAPGVRRLYSRYERNGKGLVDGGGGAGVVSYGALEIAGDGTPNPAGFLGGSVCDAASPLGTFARPSSCQAFVGGADAGRGGPKAALLDASRGGFKDVDRGVAVNPINIDLGMLAAAMHENRNGELGIHACLPGAAGGCPDSQMFNGVLYVSASRGVSSSAPAGTIDFPDGDGRQQERLPWPLCGTFTSGEASFEGGEAPGLFKEEHFADCEDDNWARIDAVRLVRGRDLSAFAATGLTIVSDLPVYVQGDFNQVGDSVRIAIIAERVTFLSPKWRDVTSPLLGAHTTVPDGSAVRARVSLLTGATAPVGPIQDVVRVIEPKTDVTLFGGLVTLFESPIPVTTAPRKLTWVYPKALFTTDVDAQPPAVPRGTFILSSTRGR
jgi:hypothetical protein